MSRGFGKKYFGKINKDQGQKIVGFVHFAEIPAPRTCARAAQTYEYLFICFNKREGVFPPSLIKYKPQCNSYLSDYQASLVLDFLRILYTLDPIYSQPVLRRGLHTYHTRHLPYILDTRTPQTR